MARAYDDQKRIDAIQWTKKNESEQKIAFHYCFQIYSETNRIGSFMWKFILQQHE